MSMPTILSCPHCRGEVDVNGLPPGVCVCPFCAKEFGVPPAGFNQVNVTLPKSLPKLPGKSKNALIFWLTIGWAVVLALTAALQVAGVVSDPYFAHPTYSGALIVGGVLGWMLFAFVESIVYGVLVAITWAWSNSTRS